MRRRSAVALILTLLLGASAAVTEPHGDARLVGTWVWSEPDAWFGGLSGLDLDSDGRRFHAISDRGYLIRGQFVRSGGRIVGLRHEAPVVLDHRRPEDLTGRSRDAEGLAVRPGGSICISFEGTARIGCFRRAGGPVQVIPTQPAFERLHQNRSLEALAADRTGALWTVPESSAVQGKDFPMWRWDGRHWSHPYTVPRRGSFLPVGADFGPDGRFYLLERAASPFGFRSRVRSWRLETGGIRDERVHLQTPSLRHDNLEGLAVWRDGQGRVRLTMISDDNYLFVQRTEIVEYVLPGASGKGQ